MHEKTAVPELVEELYTFLRQADARELDLLFAKLDAAGGDKAATAAVQMEIDSFQTHIVPVIADIDAGFGNEEATYLFAKKMIMAGAGCLQLENQVSDAKQCGHQGGKVTVPHDVFLSKIRACRHAFLELGVTDGVIVARTDSLGAQLTQNFAVSKTPGDLGSLYNSFLAGAEITNPNDIVDSDVLIKQGGKLIKPNRLASGLFEFRVGTGVDRVVLDCITSLQNGADLLWIETDTPNVQAIAEMVNRVRKVVPNAKLVYNNSPSFNWTLNFRQQVFDAMQAEGKNVSSYNRTTLMGAEYDETELGQIADEKIRNFQREASQHAGIFHHLITLPTYHTAAQSTDSLARDYFGEEAMLGYVKKVQRVEIREGIACVKHQNMAGSDMGDRHKEFFSGDSALKAGTKENTMNQFDDPNAGKIPYVDKPGSAIAPMAVRSKL
jgi:isocitrate lyase